MINTRGRRVVDMPPGKAHTGLVLAHKGVAAGGV